MAIRFNTPDVIQESFDSETVIVNLRIGVYFSLDPAGQPLWDLIGKGATEEELSSLWQKTYGVGGNESQHVVRVFLQELYREQLITGDLTEILSESVTPPAATALRPALQKFTDLQDLLMLDPIHDVDERGWPHAKPDAETSPAA